ncbi:transmembrane protein 5-like [Tropilaelaps mercedesae]|uniref:Transmembrane protein 5-like n=1 Tax=Tropilaelaps mercedesae TaxID=418985 RepID=A0A1V9XD54_9ACAR|nr:transmembrane protein 5-like [Tropilaelaps mercedesae]
MYQYALSLSDLTLNPVGFNSECYRIYEALALGSVPVIEDRTTPGLCQSPPLRLLKKHRAPVMYVKDWATDLPRILGQEAALSLKEKIERRVALVEWYEGFKLAMRKQLVQVVRNKFGFTDVSN